MTIPGCIADDFTGATDITGLISLSGVKASLSEGLPETPPDDGALVEV